LDEEIIPQDPSKCTEAREPEVIFTTNGKKLKLSLDWKEYLVLGVIWNVSIYITLKLGG